MIVVLLQKALFKYEKISKGSNLSEDILSSLKLIKKHLRNKYFKTCTCGFLPFDLLKKSLKDGNTDDR